MKRRNFLTSVTLASVGTVALLANSCDLFSNKEIDNPDRKLTDDDFVLNEETISSLREKLTSGKYTSEKLVELYLKRIDQIDKNGFGLNSIIELNPDALSIAKSLDEDLKNSRIKGVLHGIPVLIKDNIDTADKMQTTAGSIALAGNIASKNAFVVQNLIDAGAIIIGKTNLSEWANFRSDKSSSGWSSKGGQTKNPYILDHSPCGSSSGSGTAVAANLCIVAVGTETDGSLVCPASVSGIVSIKPTVGLISRSGIIPISKTQDTAGPMARTVKDASILLGALVGVDENDEITKESIGKFEKDYTKFLDSNGLKRKRIGVEKKLQGNNPLLHDLQNKAIDVITKNGGTVIEIEYLDKISEISAAEFEVLQYEFKDGLNKYLSNSNSKIKSLKELIDFNIKNESKTMPYFKQEILDMSEQKGGLDDKLYLDSLQKSHFGSRKIIDDVMSKHDLDAICGLTIGPACSIDVIYGDRWGDVSLTTPAAASGYPHITVPCGEVYDLPVGFSFFGLAYSEPKLISIAYAFEQKSNTRKKPRFKKSFF